MRDLKAPFFILGNPRSGTTLFRLMLDAHSEVTVPPESGFMIWFYQKYKCWHINGSYEEMIKEFITDLKTAKKINNWRFNFNSLNEFLTVKHSENYTELINDVYTYYALELGKEIKLFGDKNNFHLNHIREITEIYKHAKFIHIIRDGRDVACSYKELNNKKINSEFAPKLSDNIEDIADEWLENNNLILNDLEKYSSPKNFISIKYEKLVKESCKTLKRACDFLDIDYQSRMLNYYKNSKSFEPDEFLQWKANTKKPLQENKIKRYITDLSPIEIELFNRKASSLLNRFGYDY